MERKKKQHQCPHPHRNKGTNMLSVMTQGGPVGKGREQLTSDRDMTVNLTIESS